MDLRSLLSCFSVAILAIAIWGHLPTRLVGRPLPRRIALGLLLGFGAVGSMLVPVQVERGILFDLRGPMLASAGFIGGPISILLGVMPALLYRVYVGGIGMVVGCVSILTTSSIGLTAYYLKGRRTSAASDLPLLAAAVSGSSFLSICYLGWPWTRTIEFGGPISLLIFACTWLFPLSLLRDEHLYQLLSENWIYRTIIEKLPDSLNAKDAQGRFLAANPATARLMHARTAKDLIGKTDHDFYPIEIANGFLDEERLVLEGATVGPVDQEIAFQDGSLRWLTSMKTPLRSEGGNVIGVITHNRDVTDRKRLEVELARAQTYLQEALATMADGLVVYDADGVIRFCNHQYRELFPATADLRSVGNRFSDIIRASVSRGEESPSEALETWIEKRTLGLRDAGDRLLALDDGRIIEARTRPLPGGDTLVVFNDVTTRKQLETELLRRATHDPLTGLPNRAEFDFQFAALRDRVANTGEPFAVLMLDLDRFKQVNDTLGHAAGDQLLIEVARRLRGAIRSSDFVARLGGDEFAFVVTGPDVELGAERLAARVLSKLHRPFALGGHEVKPGGSIGIALFPQDTKDPSTVAVLSDQALYEAKRKGGGIRVAACEIAAGTGGLQSHHGAAA